MPTPTYDLIASNVLSSSAASVTFSSIPSTYRDLVVVIRASVASSTYGWPLLQFNNDSSTNYRYVETYGASSSTYAATSGSNGVVAINGGNPPMTTTDIALVIYQIMDYTASKKKTVLTRTDSPGVLAGMSQTTWENTATISSIKIVPTNGGTAGSTFNSGGTFYLYGIVS